ncbi:MAG: EAL domain-containing protein [Lachnospiraceae bacterium]
MNIQVQCCGAAILLLLLYFFLSQETLGLKSEKMFMRVMGISLVCICLDILSVVAIVYRDFIPEFLLEFICKTYIVSLTWVGFSGLMYAVMDTKTRNRRKSRIRKNVIFLCAGSIAIYLLPIHYYQEGNVVYTYGPACMMTYVIALIFVFSTLYIITVRGQEMNPKRRKAVRLWMLIWIVAAAIQFFNAKLLLVGFATAFGIMILFFELENPEANIDRETGAYNSHALLEYLKQCYESQKNFSVILLGLEEYQENEEKVQQADAALKEIVQYLGKFRDIKVFKNVERELVLLIEDELRMQEILAELQDRFQYAWNRMNKESLPIVLNPYYVLVPNSSATNNAEEVLRLMKYYKFEKYIHTDNRVIYVDEDKIEQMRERDKTEKLILSAIEEDRVEVFYQPIYSVSQKKFTSAEALARIREKNGDIIPPAKFIPIAEENGLISRLGEIVFDKTCRFIKEHNLKDYGVDYVEVNLSVKQCENGNFSDIYIGIMQKYDLPPECINLEITETASIQTKQILLENMERLIEHGVHFSLDDFGNGESNLNYIVDMPVSIVKFDKYMSQAYFEKQKAKFVMEAAMRMIHDMELKIVSEGVETKEQVDTIVGLGIDYIQGYHFSKPLPAAQYLEFIRENNGR